MSELHPLLAARWSPFGFDDRHEIAPAELTALLEAARWAPSAGNAQPWRFLPGRRGDAAYQRILDCLGDGERRWAWRAAALVVAARVGTDAAAAYALGQAVAHLGVQATALRLHTHQITGVDAGRLGRELALPTGVEPHAVVAVGRLGDPESLPGDLRRREFRLRERQPLDRLVLGPLPGPTIRAGR